jgi:hypothetical protein
MADAKESEPQAARMTHPSLMWQPHQPIAIDVPGQVLYEEVTADSTSTSGFTFNFRSPADNALMDNCVIIEYPISITVQATADDAYSADYRADLQGIGGATAVNADRMDELQLAFRQCFAIARAIQNLSVTINGSNFNVQPIYWLDALNRLYFSEEEARTICSSSGGEFDGPWPTGIAAYRTDQTQRAGNANANAVKVNFCGIQTEADDFVRGVPDKSFINEGLEKRWNRFLTRIYEKYANRTAKAELSATDNATDRAGRVAVADGAITCETAGGVANSAFTFSLFERLPIAPFLFHNSKDARMSIPNIRQVNITAQFATDMWKHVLQGQGNGQLIAGVTRAPVLYKRIAILNDAKCKLHCRWYLTDAGIPPVVTLRAPKYQQYIQAITYNPGATGIGPGATASRSFSNIQLDSIPDKFFIFVSKRPESFHCQYPSEFYLSIKNITLTIGGSSGRLTSLTSYQMYENFLKLSAHGGESKLNYEDWYKFHCVAILDAADIGLVAGAGYNYKTNLTVNLDVESYWDLQGIYGRRREAMTIPNGDNLFNIIVLCCYNQHYIQLNSSGGSKSGMTMVPRM